jgi:hypothetical protein
MNLDEFFAGYVESWKEIVEPSPGHFTHHLELWSQADLDSKVRLWLNEAWLAAA